MSYAYYFYQDKRKCNQKGRDCIEKNFAETFFCNTTCEGIYADVQKATNEGKELEEDNEKISQLVKQYNEFKKRNLPNFFFNPEKRTEQFSKC